MNARPDLVRRAFRLECLSAGWTVIEAVIAGVSGFAAHSLSLIAFGADSIIELASAGVLLWRLRTELLYVSRFSEEMERQASKIAGALLFLLAIYVALGIAADLGSHDGQEFSEAGFAIALLTIPVRYVLSSSKLRLADQIGSRALRADAFASVTCGYLSGTVVLGLLAQLLFAAWWVDDAASAVIVFLLIREGREAWTGDACSHKG